MRIIAATKARSGLPALLDAVAEGETFVLTRHGRPVARLVPLMEPDDAFMAAEAPVTYGAGVTMVSRDAFARAPGEAIESAGPSLFGTAVMRAVLAPFVERPDRSFYQRELVRVTGKPLRSVQREVDRLVGDGLVTAERSGNRVYYRAAPTPVFRRVRALLAPHADLVLTLRGELEPLGDRVRLALVFGSIARGDEGPDSDVDLLVVGDVSRWDLVPLVRRVEREIGREVNDTLYTPEEFRDRVRAEDYFVAALLAGPRIAVVGSLDAVG
jgi:prevent-host-death family protein